MKLSSVLISIRTMKISTEMKFRVRILAMKRLRCTQLLVISSIHFQMPNTTLTLTYIFYILSVVIVSNETHHERDIAYCCNIKLLNFVLDKSPATNRIFFWSDGYASQFRFRYVIYSLLLYHQQVTLMGLCGSPSF